MAGKAPLLLHLAGVLLFLQIALWAKGQQRLLIPTHVAVDSATIEHAGGHTPRPSRLQSPDSARSHANDPRRYYDPGLAMVAENLDAASRYFSAMALEECYALSHEGLSRFRDDFMRRLASTPGSSTRHDNRVREYAFNRSNRDCIGFDGAPISPGYVLGLLSDSDTPVRAATLAVAWELVACDFGLECGADSKLLNSLCAYQGQCGAFSYEDWLSRYTESREEFAEILRLRSLLRRGLMVQDWHGLGWSVLKPAVKG